MAPFGASNASLCPQTSCKLGQTNWCACQDMDWHSARDTTPAAPPAVLVHSRHACVITICAAQVSCDPGCETQDNSKYNAHCPGALSAQQH
jgi:hypothetical protein